MVRALDSFVQGRLVLIDSHALMQVFERNLLLFHDSRNFLRPIIQMKRSVERLSISDLRLNQLEWVLKRFKRLNVSKGTMRNRTIHRLYDLSV